MGGEKINTAISDYLLEGSPPHGRGKVAKKYGVPESTRITPAWEGKRATPRKNGCPGGDHPRVGGEKAALAAVYVLASGSPPRGRGKGSNNCTNRKCTGITPAWAGKSTWSPSFKDLRQDHPRVGGEKLFVSVNGVNYQGSPPRGRGKGERPASAALLQGITPAWAGKRLKRSHRSGIFISGPIPFHSVLHRPAGSGGSRAGRDGSPAGQPQNTGPA